MVEWRAVAKWSAFAILASALLGIAVAAWSVTLVVIVAIALWTTFVHIQDRRRYRKAVDEFRKEWRPAGADALIVYSDSPHWGRYIEDNWLARWGNRAVVLNWSERRLWRNSTRSEARLFHACSPSTEFNPLAIIVPPSGYDVEVIRFWRAFRDFKHGKAFRLRQAEARLDAHLARAPYSEAPTAPVS